MINFNEIKVSGKNPVFNNGEAGELMATMVVSRKKPTDAVNRPDWSITFTDSEGRTLNEGFYYIDETKYTSSEKYNNHLKFEAARLKHFVNALYGEMNFPAFNSTKEMLDWCMTTLVKQNNAKVKIGVTFGTVKRPNNKGYLGLKSTFPFISGDPNYIIGFSKNDLVERPAPSAPKEEDTTKDLPWD